MNIEAIWKRMKEFEGETYYTVSGLPYTYEFINENNIQPIRDGDGKWIMSKNLFEKALLLIHGSKKEFNHRIIGSSYAYGILTDNRINN